MYFTNPHARALHLPMKYLRKVRSEGEKAKWPRAHLLSHPELQNTCKNLNFNNFMFPNASAQIGTPFKICG